MKNARHLISIDDEEIRIRIPPLGSLGRGAIAYFLYMLDVEETWDSIGAQLGTQRPWKSARQFATRNNLNWPPRPALKGRPGRPWTKAKPKN
jgi:hypothetical protein